MASDQQPYSQNGNTSVTMETGSQIDNHAEEEAVQEEQRVNPFDAGLLDTLHHATFTPSVFAMVVSPSHSSADSPVSRPSAARSRPNHRPRRRRFRWSIDHIAALNPAQIDESEFVLQEAANDRYDEQTEARLQAAIDAFFSQPIIAPSPWKSTDSTSRFAGASAASSVSVSCSGATAIAAAESPALSQSSPVATPSEPASVDRNNYDEGVGVLASDRRDDDFGDDINSSVYLLSSSPESNEGSPREFLTNGHRSSVGIAARLSSPDVSPIKSIPNGATS